MMRRVRHLRPRILAIGLALCGMGATPPREIQFVDVTRETKVDFTEENSATSSKYLLETMGGGVALLDYDNDGRLDIFFVNGARIPDPMPQGAAPDKSDRKFWNRLF